MTELETVIQKMAKALELARDLQEFGLVDYSYYELKTYYDILKTFQDALNAYKNLKGENK